MEVEIGTVSNEMGDVNVKVLLMTTMSTPCGLCFRIIHDAHTFCHCAKETVGHYFTLACTRRIFGKGVMLLHPHYCSLCKSRGWIMQTEHIGSGKRSEKKCKMIYMLLSTPIGSQ